MGNDMYNDEQLKHAEILQKETEDALGFWKDRALKAEAERDAAVARLNESRRTIYFTWRDVENCREALSIHADIKGDTLEEVVRFLLNERAEKGAPE